MELESILNKPYSNQEKLNFIVENNHKLGYEIKETETALEAWGYTEEELAQKERERLSRLKLTKREVFLALYNDSGITSDEIKSVITDPVTLIEFEYATEYYRGNPLIDAIGSSLGYSKEELDYLFENKCFPLKVEDSTKEADINA